MKVALICVERMEISNPFTQISINFLHTFQIEEFHLINILVIHWLKLLPFMLGPGLIRVFLLMFVMLH